MSKTDLCRLTILLNTVAYTVLNWQSTYFSGVCDFWSVSLIQCATESMHVTCNTLKK